MSADTVWYQAITSKRCTVTAKTAVRIEPSKRIQFAFTMSAVIRAA
jgi:hypothetical protein